MVSPSLASQPPPDTLDMMVFFAPDSAELDATNLTNLARMARDARGDYDGAVAVTGHADDGEADPAGISRARAESTKAVLVNLGVDPSRISVHWRATRPAPVDYPPEGVAIYKRNAEIAVEKRCRPHCPLPEYRDSISSSTDRGFRR
jgi:hypothetical protein